VRVAVQALAATLGGCQSLHTNGMDEALALPTERSARTALRTQQLLAYEHGAGDVIDPLGGSFTIEKLTTDLEEEAAALIGEIDKLGGMVTAIETGYVQRQIEKAAYDHQLAIESGERPVVGINCFEEEERSDPQITVHEIPEGVEQRKAEDLEAWRAERDSDAVATSLDALHVSASSDTNVVEAIFEAVKQGATLGEVADRLRDAFGEYRDPSCTT